jgi:translation initiation factor 2 beta subunit (eIF-2beta)/eIF-5
MKNIHILLTDKPSRFVTSKENKKCYLYSIEEFKNVDKFIEYDSKSWDSKNIYISNDEQPKHNDYYTTDGKEIYYCNTLNPTRNNHYKKIILTTDQDLIKDGVQAIDDEFLEWFVKNPSCEEVEDEWVDFSQSYFIKITKEEAKQEKDYTALLQPVGTKQTAVEWLESEMLKPNLSMKDIFEHAKEMENQEKLEAFIEGYKQRAEKSELIFDNASRMFAIHLYKETFNK